MTDTEVKYAIHSDPEIMSGTFPGVRRDAGAIQNTDRPLGRITG